MSARFPVIEQENRVAHAIERGWVASGFDIVVASTGEEGYFLLSRHAAVVRSAAIVNRRT